MAKSSNFVSVKQKRNLLVIMANKPLQFVHVERKMSFGANVRKIVQVAKLTDRHRVSFPSFCKCVAKSTTLNPREAEAVLNYATEIAHGIMANGDIMEFGDLGTLNPSFKRKIVPKGTTLNVQKNIEKPVARLNPSKKYFTLTTRPMNRRLPSPKKRRSPLCQNLTRTRTQLWEFDQSCREKAALQSSSHW